MNEKLPPIEHLPGDWLDLQRLWERVITDDTVVAVNSGGWIVRREPPARGFADANADSVEVCIYVQENGSVAEIGRWHLGDVRRARAGGRDE
jgi:hypothetical protein